MKRSGDPSSHTWSGANLREIWTSARWGIRLAWSTNRWLILGEAALTISMGLLPAALALAVRGLINATVATFRSGTATITPLLPWLALGFGLTLLDALSRIANKFLTLRLRDDLDYRIASTVLEHAARQDLAFFEDPRFQDSLRRAQENTAEHMSRFVVNALTCLTSLFQIVSLFGILVYMEPLVLAVVILFAIPYLRFQWQVSARQYEVLHSRTTKRRWTGYFVSCLTGRASVGEVKLLGLAPLLIEKFRALMAEFRDQDRSVYKRSLKGSALFAVVTTSAFYALFVRVAYRALTGGLSIGDLAIFGGATARLRTTVETGVLAVSGAMQEALHVSDLIEFLKASPRIVPGVGRTLPACRGEIEFRNVSFAYPGTSEQALTEISLRIRPGETVAVVGENGAGKTTLVKLIARLYDPDTGSITMDGVDLKDLALEHLHGRIAFVFQSFGRYEATAGENIAYGDWRRMLGDPAQVEQIARQAGVHEMIAALPERYDTQLGRTFGQSDLSGGQWQRLAVARAFARDASLLILDEPTSNLDARAEYELFCRFRELAHGRTTVLISHRFSTVSMADRIVVMDRGRIIEEGTHRELLARAGSYAQLYELHQRQMAPTAAD